MRASSFLEYRKLTVYTTDSEINYVGNGVATVFAVPFLFTKNSDLIVTRVDATGNSTILVIGSDYTVSGAGNAPGGTVTLSSALAVGATLNIRRSLPVVQETDLRNQGKFYQQTIEDALDYLTLLIQQAFGYLGRALLRPIGKAYYDAQGRNIKNLADPVNAQDATTKSWVSTLVNGVQASLTTLAYALYNKSIAYAESLVAGVVGGYGAFLQAGLGAVTRTFQDKMRDVVSVKDFGAKFDGVSDDGQAINACLAHLASTGGGVAVCPRGTALSSIAIQIPDGCELRGEGRGDEELWNAATRLVFTGTGLQGNSIPGVTGRSIANPDAGAAYLADSGTRGDTYQLLDFSSSFSAAVILGKGSRIAGLGIYPNFNGVEGYISDSTGALSDAWDVGVWSRNAGAFALDGVAVAGHWRKTAVLVSSSDLGDGVVPANERGLIHDCFLNGFRAISVRSPNPTTGTNYGFGGLRIIKSFLRDLNHKSGYLATSSYLSAPFAFPSGVVEIDGATMRGVAFTDCTFMARDDQIFTFGDCQEVKFLGCYAEAKNAIVSGSWLTTIGTRAVSMNTTDLLTVYFDANSKYAVDFAPYYTRESSVTRYSSSGAFNPDRSSDDDYQNVVFTNGSGPRLRRVNDRWRIYGYDQSESFDVDTSGNIRVKNNASLVSKGTSLRIRRTVDGVETDAIWIPDSGNVQFTGWWRPSADDAAGFGTSSLRPSQYYAVNGTINTSDAREKSDVREMSLAEQSAAIEMAGHIGFYQWLAAISQKGGDGARLHCGLTVQKAIQIMESHGLDPMKYGFICYDSWDETPEQIESWEDEFDDDGQLIREAGSRVVQAYIPAGDRYSFREGERNAFIISGLAAKLSNLESRLSVIETNNVAGN